MIFRLKIRFIAFLLAEIVTFTAIVSVIKNPTVLALCDNQNGFYIIMYHHITEDENKTGDYVISTEQLENDFKYLKKNGYKTLSMRELYSIDKYESNLPEKSIMLTFDDGQESFYKYAYPLLKKYNLTAVFSVIGKYTEQFSTAEDHNISYSHVTWDEIKTMIESGIVEIGNHSYDMHSNNAVERIGVTIKKGESLQSYRTAIKYDIDKFNSLFEKYVGFTPNFFAYPFGRYSSETEKIIKENGFSAALTCYETKNVPHSNNEWLYKLGRFNRSGKISTAEFFKKIRI